MASTSAKRERRLKGFVRGQLRRLDRPAWRLFLLALLGLALSFFLALYASALHNAGRYKLAAAVASLSLLLAGIVGAKTVPYLARRTALERWMSGIEYDFTREGGVYLGVVVIITVAALNTGNNLLFMIVACLLAGILVSGVMSQIVLSGLELELELPEHLFAGRPMALRFTLRNLKWLLPSFSISAEDQPSTKRRKRSAAVLAASGANPAGWPAPTGPRPDGVSGSRGKPALREADGSVPVKVAPDGHRTSRILSRPFYIPYLPRRSYLSAQVDVTFPWRGRYAQDGFRISTRFPFGLLRKSREVALRREVLVLPSIQPTEEFYEILPLISGEVESLEKGRGHDLYAIRDYRQTDTARHVDWKATAKVQQLKVREFTREDERRVALVFDTRLPAADDQILARFERAVTFCACLGWHFYEINAQMRFISESLETPMASAGEIIYPMLENLALVQPLVALGPAASTAAPSACSPLADARGSAASGRDILAALSSAPASFNILVTFRPRGSIPTSLWSSSYVVFGDSL